MPLKCGGVGNHAKVLFRTIQIVRMARLGLALAPTLALKVLTNLWLGLLTGYLRILTNFNQKVNLLEKEKKEKDAK